MAKGLKDVFSSSVGAFESLASLPETGKGVMIAILAIGGLGILLLICGLSWGIGTGNQDAAAMVAAGVAAAGAAAKVAV
jgi:hypothetical protein